MHLRINQSAIHKRHTRQMNPVTRNISKKEIILQDFFLYVFDSVKAVQQPTPIGGATSPHADFAFAER